MRGKSAYLSIFGPKNPLWTPNLKKAKKIALPNLSACKNTIREFQVKQSRPQTTFQLDAIHLAIEFIVNMAAINSNKI